ncbi:unnamed protein product, partial [Cylicostephanus goldi]
PETALHSYICLSNKCAIISSFFYFQIKKVIERRQDDQNYCYSLSHKSSKPFGQEHDYSEHDEFVGTTRPRYELLAGCLKVDDDKVRIHFI